MSYRIAVGPRQRRKTFMIRTIRPLDRPSLGLERVAKANGFSLHAGVSCEGHQKNKRRRLCRCIARPAVAVPRLSLIFRQGSLYLEDALPGWHHASGIRSGRPSASAFDCAIGAPRAKPRVNLTRYHGVLAPARPVPITAAVGALHRPNAVKALNESKLQCSIRKYAKQPRAIDFYACSFWNGRR